MNEQLFVDMYEIILLFFTVSGIAIILAASWYDVRAISQKKRLRTIAPSLAKRRQPFVTILLYAHSTAPAIDKCLKSIARSNYKRYEVVIVNDTSTTITPEATSIFKKLHPAISATVQAIRTHTSRLHALQIAHKKARKNDLVFMLDDTDCISHSTLSDAVTYFIAHPDLDILRTRQRFAGDMTMRHLQYHFTDLSTNMIKKAFSRKPTSYEHLYHPGTMARSSTLAQNATTPVLFPDYSSEAIFTSPVSTNNRSLGSPRSKARILLTITGLLTCIYMMTYSFYTAAILQSSTLLSLGWILVSLWLFAVIWSDTTLELPKKWALTFAIPFMYFLFYVQLFIALAKNIWHLLHLISIPPISLGTIRKAIAQEAYSTRF